MYQRSDVETVQKLFNDASKETSTLNSFEQRARIFILGANVVFAHVASLVKFNILVK